MIRSLPNPLLLIISTLSFAGASASAQTLIDWGGDYVTVQRNASGADFADNTLATGTARTPATEYATTDNGTIAGPAFYGGSGVAGGGTMNANAVSNNVVTDFFFLQASNTTASRDIAGLIYFQSAVFNNAWLSSNDEFEFSLTGRVGSVSGAITDASVRLVLLSGSQFYVSDATFALGKNSTAITDSATYAANTTSISSGTLGIWSTYDPATSIVPTGLGAPAPIDFSSIDAVGFLVTATTDTTAAANVPLQVYEFSVTAVPEPSATLLVLGGLGMLTCLVRRR